MFPFENYPCSTERVEEHQGGDSTEVVATHLSKQVTKKSLFVITNYSSIFNNVCIHMYKSLTGQHFVTKLSGGKLWTRLDTLFLCNSIRSKCQMDEHFMFKATNKDVGWNSLKYIISNIIHCKVFFSCLFKWYVSWISLLRGRFRKILTRHFFEALFRNNRIQYNKRP